MLGNLLKSFWPARPVDPFFGPLAHIKGRPPGASYWEASRQFAPLARTVEVFIGASGGVELPTEDQRTFFRWVEANYDLICSSMQKPFESDGWTSQLLAGTFADTFALSSFTIPIEANGRPSWEITFESEADPDHLFTATLDGLEVRHLSVDG